MMGMWWSFFISWVVGMPVSSNDIIKRRFSDALDSVVSYIDNSLLSCEIALLTSGFIRFREVSFNHHIFHTNNDTYGRSLPVLIREELIAELIRLYPDWEIKRGTVTNYTNKISDGPDYTLDFIPRKNFKKKKQVLQPEEQIEHRSEILDLGEGIVG